MRGLSLQFVNSMDDYVQTAEKYFKATAVLSIILTNKYKICIINNALYANLKAKDRAYLTTKL